MRHYIALIHKEAGSDYGVSFPDLPGCITAAATLDDARVLAEEALALHLAGLAQDNEAVPEPLSLEKIMEQAGNRDGVAVLVAAVGEGSRMRHVDITMPAEVLEEIDAYAERAGMNRSGFLAYAAKREMNRA